MTSNIVSRSTLLLTGLKKEKLTPVNIYIFGFKNNNLLD